ncbi:MAG: dihydrolipoamide acetyltransferase, partial [Mycolicibacterium sp.]|nr:dihydrolipoamide acetyltransferase [Mycolicibacterium sp.]
MAFSVQMPALGESVTEGTVTRWLKQEGDTVEQDEPLLEVSTDKVDTEIPSPASGVLKKIIAQEDDTVEVGGELAVIGDAGEAAQPADGQPGAAVEQRRPAEQQPAQQQPAEQQPAEPERAAQPERRPQPAGGKSTPVLMPELGESVT